MREVIFKHLNQTNSRKKDIFLKETFEKDGVVSKTERRCFYFIKDVVRVEDGKDLQKWIDAQNDIEPVNKRHFYIMKEHNDGLGKDKIICKIAGTFYAIVEKSIYTIAFLHSFKVSFAKDAYAK